MTSAEFTEWGAHFMLCNEESRHRDGAISWSDAVQQGYTPKAGR